ncbi:sulfate/molybdate ABC transporter ATP-binding protein [Acetivibrio clariflavus]|uniref:sulfate/molybdate ABC transporter ATP-binding protein n=1 Tax=Acetivibrio clariflavus TaxID=288965 RepID=UPI0005B78007|nr:sulfate/molybdate ABC transporter ATP-binding protein [Acetivibrio clariflavus]HPU42165.1 sulfate/molybdate ABC transporter ATP-binding protein [Acetivibrio clariflavus]
MELLVNIKKRLPGFTLKVNFKASEQVMGLLGASGSGKSMTLRCIAGIEKPDEGKIVLNDRVLFDSEKGINIPSRLRKVGYLFQNYALFPNMTVEDNIGFGLQKLSKEKRKAVIQEKIEMMKLNGLEKRFPFQLSGGQQQRVALARALAIEPEMLLLDEPFSALDDHLRYLLTKQLIDTLSNYHGITLFVTHNIEEAFRICSELTVLNNGAVESAGKKEDIFRNPDSLSVARITGCKNFSAAKYLSNNELEAVDWGIRLKTDRLITKELKYVGMRAHYIRLALENDRDNVFCCWPSFVNESPFRVTVYLFIGNRPESKQDYHLQWEIPKEKWMEIGREPLPWKICLSPERLIILNR